MMKKLPLGNLKIFLMKSDSRRICPSGPEEGEAEPEGGEVGAEGLPLTLQKGRMCSPKDANLRKIQPSRRFTLTYRRVAKPRRTKLPEGDSKSEKILRRNVPSRIARTRLPGMGFLGEENLQPS